MSRNPVLRVNLRSAGKKLFAAGAAVAISVAFIVAGILMVDSFNSSLTQQLEAEAAGSDLIIETVGLSAWDEETDEPLRDDVPLAEAIGELDGVAIADAIGSGYISEVAADGSTRIGFQVGEQSQTREGEIVQGREAQAEDEIVISSAAVEGRGLELGDTLSAQDFVYAEDAQEGAEPTVVQEDYTVVGVLETQGSPRGYLTAEGWTGCPSALARRRSECSSTPRATSSRSRLRSRTSSPSRPRAWMRSGPPASPRSRRRPPRRSWMLA